MRFKDFVSGKKKLLGTFDGYKIFKVNGLSVRQSSKELEEFGGSSNHYMIDPIPEDEIWIEDDIPSQEVSLLIATELSMLKLIKGGMSKNKAYELSLKMQKQERDEKGEKESIYIKYFGEMRSEKIKVWFVDGKKVRDLYKPDFIEGGHGYVYDFVPKDEIWIEHGPHSDREAPLILLHEFTELCLMKYRKMSYDKAHEISSKVEFESREQGIGKDYVMSLTKDQIWSRL